MHGRSRSSYPEAVRVNADAGPQSAAPSLESGVSNQTVLVVSRGCRSGSPLTATGRCFLRRSCLIRSLTRFRKLMRMKRSRIERSFNIQRATFLETEKTLKKASRISWRAPPISRIARS